MRPPRQSWTRIDLGAVVALSAPRAEAHLVTTGMGAVCNGIGHYFWSLGEVLPTVDLALLAGLRGPGVGRRVLLLLPLAWIAGGVLGLLSGVPHFSSNLSAAWSLLLLGGLALVDCALPLAILAILPVVVGGALGFFNGMTTRMRGSKVMS